MLKILVLLGSNYCYVVVQNLIETSVFEKNAGFFAENWQNRDY
jgi:hypothetical protein